MRAKTMMVLAALAIFLSEAGPARAMESQDAQWTYYGWLAGGLNQSTGQHNTFIGSFAGFSNLQGYRNTFLGQATGINNKTGNSNTFVGDAAGNKNTASNNTFVGQNAGYANSNGNSNTLLGQDAGKSNVSGSFNTFLGQAAGNSNKTGNSNTFVGRAAGYSNTTGRLNTALGLSAGYNNQTGIRNVFLGYGAGKSEKGSNRLYVDTCYDGGTCMTPLIYGEFDTRILELRGSLGINVWPENPIHLASGAYCSKGGKWIDASSRDYKENIVPVASDEAIKTFDQLSPVKFTYKAEPGETHLGFIAEDVPAILATRDRRGMSPMDVVALLTKVVQEQQSRLREQQERIQRLEAMVSEKSSPPDDRQASLKEMAEQFESLKAELNGLKSISRGDQAALR